MFREMRRAAQKMTDKDNLAVLRRCTSGVLALAGDEGYPYAVPMSYVYRDGRIYFHCAASGHKLDAVTRCDKASFCVIDQDAVVPEKYTTLYRSVIAFGRIRVMENDQRKRSAIELLAERYNPGHPEEAAEEIKKSMDRLCIMELEIEHLTGKESVDLLRAKEEER